MSALIAALVLPACNWSEFRDFFQAREVDRNTHIEVSTRPALGKLGVPGAVFIDQERVSDTTPYTLQHVTPGKHHVRVVATGYVSQELEIDAKEGQTTRPSLALQPMPNEPGQAPRTPQAHDNSKPRAKKEREDPAEPGVVGVAHTLLLTATPALSVTLDGSALGSAVGLRVAVSKAAGIIKLGEGAKGMVFSYSNKASSVTLRAKELGARTVSVDGTDIGSSKSFELDQRPRRIELTDVEGKKQVVLAKMVD